MEVAEVEMLRKIQETQFDDEFNNCITNQLLIFLLLNNSKRIYI